MDKIYDHSDQEVDRTLKAPTFLKKSEITKIEKHIENTIGKSDMVFHELVSQVIHADVYLVGPTSERDFYTLVTVGMSALPMKAPDKESQFIELMISLPKEWKVDHKDFEDENNYWPVRLLKILSRFPFDYDTWLGSGHTIPYGNPPKKYSENCNFKGALLLPSLRFRPSFECRVGFSKKVRFYALYPLYENEMEYKVQNGLRSLLGKFDEYNVNEIVDIRRGEIKFT